MPEISKLMERVCKEYEMQLEGSDGEKYYREKRGLEDTTIRKFRLGFAPNVENFLINRFGQLSLNELVRAGLVWKGDRCAEEEFRRDPRDRMRDLAAIPIFNINGEVVRFQGRVIREYPSEIKYVNCLPMGGHEDILYGLNFAKEEVGRTKELNLFEGTFDVISAHQTGMLNSAGLLGGYFDAGRLAFIYQNFGKIRVNLIFDYDVPGITSAAKAKGMFSHRDNIGVYVVRGKKVDPDDSFREGKIIWEDIVEV